MPLSCFARGRSGNGTGGDPSPAPPSSSATSVYWTHVGFVSLTWSRASLGLLLTAELRLTGEAEDDPPARFAFRPWLPWRRRGRKRFATPSGRVVGFAWDLSRARLAAHRPEPVALYGLHVSVDGELALAAGDLSSSPSSSSVARTAGFLLSRRETAVVAGDGDAYATEVVVAGEAREVSVAVVGDAAMWVAVDGEKALQVRRLRWKFRGSERLDLPRLGRLRVTWDLHGWLSSSSPAVFVLRFETDDDDDMDDDDDAKEEQHDVVRRQGSFGKQNAAGGGGESWCSSGSERRGWRRGGPFRYGSDASPTVSVASTSATSSSAGSVATVSEWAVPAEANALKDGGGFSLVVHLWKKRK
ncbi:hypothetical protein PR202_ga17955 [Eleusine coracana subsp. coracana]|uniref:Uncharacterized protein n=1 Tax=Eleusine coracana subsp. coracana TaxID=191504 RepID=A0AAV5CRM8_ELECO|nr:hypothetical protein QOZ80_6AG0511150 [Eleusine coracana subsp. coracana]GJN00751.1 hypothetical protein PR202_ga17955 [Eleusine coracana subsp. coracana]